jgi:serine/threonine protein kinase
LEHEARPTDGRPENALNCEAMIPKAKATAGEPIRTPVHLWRGVSVVQLRHPNLPDVSDFFEESGKAYLVMEFIAGRSLEEEQNSAGGPLDEKLVMGWALQLCDVLHYLHTQPQPIIFRDMKPSNRCATTATCACQWLPTDKSNCAYQ